MAEQMFTDAATLKAKAAEFEDVAGQLTQQIQAVQNTAHAMKTHLQGDAGTAGQGALERFDQSANEQQKAITAIHEALKAAGLEYESAESQNASALQGQMNL
jgi:WXG100 family type VII secretion target